MRVRFGGPRGPVIRVGPVLVRPGWGWGWGRRRRGFGILGAIIVLVLFGVFAFFVCTLFGLLAFLR